ncbi:annexin 5 [Euphorbia peplus]|nr:annexin 5 [Euphorbia peplus]
MSTLTLPPVIPHPRDDAMALFRAFKGFGCDESAVINILAHRDATHRSYIIREYNTIYSEDLFERLTKELRGKLETAVLFWLHDLPVRDATVVKEALRSETNQAINVGAATEVICSRSPSQIQHFKHVYHAKFGAHMENDIETQTFDDHKKLLLAYVSIPRYEGREVDHEMVQNDAKALYKAGEKKLGTDEKIFIRIFSERSAAHLVAVNHAYHNIYGNSLEKVVKSETSGYFRHALLTILQCAENPAKYFAKVLHKAMKGLGTNDTTLIRVIVTRTEIDMQYIKAEYLKKYKKTLNNAVHSETSGDYRNFLLSLLGPNQ